MRRLLLLFALLLVAPAAAQERILAFHSDLRIQSDGSLEVTETITVRAEGRNIRRGIYRDFPTRYHDRLGNRVVVAFEPVEVLRDGRPEPWFTERLDNGVRLNTGDDSFLRVPADITYTLRYRTTRQLGFFERHDELYWNVTGNGWRFAIEQASARVHLPQPVPVAELSAEGYTGHAGSREQAYTADARDGGARWEATRRLEPGEGLTIVLGFPKGLVPEPTRAQRLRWLLYDNRGVLVALTGLTLLLLFYLWRWHLHGRDPAPGSVFPQYMPPEGESPGGLRYLRRMGYDSRCFAADIVDMAVRGYLSIDRKKGLLSESWTLVRAPDADAGRLSDGQRAIAAKLFSKGETIELKNTNASEIGGARTQHLLNLGRRYKPRYFVGNGGTVTIGVLFFIAYTFLAFSQAEGAGELVIALLSVLGVILHVVFGSLMRAPTAEGRRLLDRVDGLKLYLGVAERDELKGLAGPGGGEPVLDGERYQALLPYAIALDVEEAWTRKFTLAVGAAAAAATAAGMRWYSGAGTVSDLGRFSSDLGRSLSSTISSSSSPPGSRSGGGGGGSSGGGGGGGGGGGR